MLSLGKILLELSKGIGFSFHQVDDKVSAVIINKGDEVPEAFACY